MIFKLVVMFLLVNVLNGEDDKWVWGNKKDATSREARYEVYEPEEFYENYQQYRPGNRPIGGGGGGIGGGFGQRPGGVYNGHNSGNYGNYGQNHKYNQYPDSDYDNSPGVLVGPTHNPLKELDRCKCTEKFNCPSPGISYGHCDVGKQYCCTSSNKADILGAPFPPSHSIDNGVLVGPGGPSGGGVRPGHYPRPQRPYGVGPSGGRYPRPGGGGGNGGFGLNSNRPIHSIDNGILVGPGYRPH